VLVISLAVAAMLRPFHSSCFISLVSQNWPTAGDLHCTKNEETWLITWPAINLCPQHNAALARRSLFLLQLISVSLFSRFCSSGIRLAENFDRKLSSSAYRNVGLIVVSQIVCIILTLNTGTGKRSLSLSVKSYCQPTCCWMWRRNLPPKFAFKLRKWGHTKSSGFRQVHFLHPCVLVFETYRRV
jgi:hypothetical protein